MSESLLAESSAEPFFGVKRRIAARAFHLEKNYV
jgi:hypothetical protein